MSAQKHHHQCSRGRLWFDPVGPAWHSVRLWRWLWSMIFLIVGTTIANADQSPLPASLQPVSVGVVQNLEAVIWPGPELVVKPIDPRKTPLILRIVRTYPHGDSHRYDLEWYGLEPGQYNLSEYVQRKDGKPAETLPALSVEVTSILPPGQVEPHRLSVERGPQLGGYRALLWIVGIFWALGLLGILVSFWSRSGGQPASDSVAGPSLAERLRPVIESASAGQANPEQLAQLERGLIAFWRVRLGLAGVDAATAYERLQDHPEAGPLLKQLQQWLHAPGTTTLQEPAKLLKPYETMLASDWDALPRAGEPA